MQKFFESEFDYKKAMKGAHTEDGRSYSMSIANVPLNESSVNDFFNEWPQYHAFPYKNKLISKNSGEQCDAILSLQEYTVFVDGTIFLL